MANLWQKQTKIIGNEEIIFIPSRIFPWRMFFSQTTEFPHNFLLSICIDLPIRFSSKQIIAKASK
jgi:hypothetical protein